MPAFCQDCHYQIDENVEISEGRQPCPKCNSLKIRYEETVSETIAVGELLSTKGYVGGVSKRKGLRFETKEGDSLSTDRGRFMKVVQYVDHENKRYIKKVTDPKTGEILRNVNEPLPDHKNRGSAKKHDT